jgi:adenosylcobinamide kinase/adenosylcobinamide-phosphate guanylyltransferase
MGQLLFVTGPVRSGKSRWAVERARAFGPAVVFVATWRGGDDEEMRERVRRHREERPDWRTLEAPDDPAAALLALDPAPSGALFDCLTLWISDRLHLSDAQLLTAWDAQLAALRRAPFPVIVVGNEVGWGPVPDLPILRRWRDLAGTLAQRTAAAADEAWLLVAGCPLRLR